VKTKEKENKRKSRKFLRKIFKIKEKLKLTKIFSRPQTDRIIIQRCSIRIFFTKIKLLSVR
jgi:hypothetical protein